VSWTLGQVKARIRSLVDDPNASWTDDAFLDPLVNEAYNDANSQLASTQSSWDIADVEVPGIQPGLPNMESFQTTGVLAQLTDQPERIDWKVAGQDPSYYQLVPNYGVLPDLQPQQGMAGWEWRSEVIWLTPSSIAVDLRVRGEFAPAPLTDDTSVLTSHPRIGYVIAYGVAALAAVVRGNPGWTQQYEQKAIEGMDEIMEQLTRESQGQVRRTGRQTRRGRSARSFVAYQ
jgi:hypothetical protein